MSAPTLVLPSRYTEDSRALWQAAVDAGWRTERLTSWRVPGWLRGRSVVLYGEPLFAAAIAPELDVELLEPTPNWLTTLPATMTGRHIRAMTLETARKLDQPAFIKPMVDKCFEARVYENGSELPDTDVLPDDTAVLLSDPVSWRSEFRCFVLDGRIATCSVYHRDHALAQHADGTWPATDAELSEARAFGSTVLTAVGDSLPPGVVLDVGELATGDWAVVETNAAWGSGIYGCDPSEVLRVVATACVPRA